MKIQKSNINPKCSVENQKFKRHVLSFVLMSLFVFSCSTQKEPRIDFGIDECASCGMVIDRPTEAAGLMVNDEFVPFCNPICLMHMVNQLKNGQQKPTQIWVSDYSNGTLIPLEKSTFFIGRIPTIMNYGVVAFLNREDAEALGKQYNGSIIDHLEFRAQFENPDKTFTVELNDRGMTPEKLLVEKGNVLQITIKYNLSESNQLSIRGYDNLSPIELPSEKTRTSFKMVADKPGAGFPIVFRNNNQIIGQLIVLGSHTKEESI